MRSSRKAAWMCGIRSLSEKEEESQVRSEKEMLELIRLLAKENRLEEFLGEKESPERIDWWIQRYCPREEK